MLLFLDVISPIPEFFVIEDNKVIIQSKILANETENLSDHIFETYIKINNDLKLTKNLKKTSMTIGPGSYTSLRVGAAFLSGLSISKDLLFSPVSIGQLLKFKLQSFKNEKVGFFVCSAKNQSFFCYIKDKENIEYIKIQDKFDINSVNINTLFYNINKIEDNTKKIKQIKFTFINEVLSNIKNMDYQKNFIIKPIYISNNNILN